MADENKRDTERVAVPAPLYGEVKVYQPMTILDISKGGAQIETPFALQLDSLHDFRLSLGERSIIVKGRIAHCHIGELKEGVVLYRTGVEFIETSGHVQSAIVHFVEALKLVKKATAIAVAAAPGPGAPPIVEGRIAD
jgi:hypothetical protein